MSPIDLKQEPACAKCHQNPSGKLLCCGKCKSVQYCSRDCQVNDWAQHKSVCRESIKKIESLVQEVSWIADPSSTFVGKSHTSISDTSIEDEVARRSRDDFAPVTDQDVIDEHPLIMRDMAIGMKINRQKKEAMKASKQKSSRVSNIIKNPNPEVINIGNVQGLGFLNNPKWEFGKWNTTYHGEGLIKISYSFPGERTVEIINQFIEDHGLVKNNITIIEYGCGRALWGRFFIENNFKVKAVDRKDSIWFADKGSGIKRFIPNDSVTLVERDEIAIDDDCSEKILFFSWPEGQNEEYAGRVLEKFKENGGRLAIYIGEKRGGSSASESLCREIYANWNIAFLPREVKAMQSRDILGTIRDHMYLLSLKTS